MHRWRSSRRTEALIEAIHEELRLSREQRERHAEMFEDTREFIREQTIRMHRYFDRHDRALSDMSDQIRANTSATWAMVDLLRGGGAAPQS